MLGQQGDRAHVLVVGNGADPGPLPDGVRSVRMEENVGLVEGRDRGWRELDDELVFFLDDDAWLLRDDTMVRVRRAFADEPALGIVSMRIVDPETGLTARRHVPRLRAGDPERRLGDDDLPRRGVGGAPGGARGRRRPARPVLVRPRGDRPRLARPRPRLADPLRRRRRRRAPEDHPGPAPDVLPAERPQPRLAGPAQPPGAARRRVPGRLGGAHHGAGARRAAAAHLVGRLRRGPAVGRRTAPTDAVAHRRADDAAGPPAGGLIRRRAARPVGRAGRCRPQWSGAGTGRRGGGTGEAAGRSAGRRGRRHLARDRGGRRRGARAARGPVVRRAPAPPRRPHPRGARPAVGGRPAARRRDPARGAPSSGACPSRWSRPPSSRPPRGRRSTPC
nr:glycosyltransferase [Angustibacter aerolatus]